jgi:hypothetical protein
MKHLEGLMRVDEALKDAVKIDLEGATSSAQIWNRILTEGNRKKIAEDKKIEQEQIETR